MRVTRQNLRHLGQMFHFGAHPAVTVYDSLGADFPLAPAPGWLNLGLWEGPGTPEEAPRAVQRLVEALAAALPPGGVVLDVGNGLGSQDRVIAAVARPRTLVALNITESQLRAGRHALREAGALPVVGNAVDIPLAGRSVDGLISVEAAFHFPARATFFGEAHRVLRPGGVLTMSDVTAERRPRTLLELWAGLTLLRFWGLGRHSLMSWRQVAALAEGAGFRGVQVEVVGERVFEPIFALTRRRLRDVPDLPPYLRVAARLLLHQWALLWRRDMMEYILLRARVPE